MVDKMIRKELRSTIQSVAEGLRAAIEPENDRYKNLRFPQAVIDLIGEDLYMALDFCEFAWNVKNVIREMPENIGAMQYRIMNQLELIRHGRPDFKDECTEYLQSFYDGLGALESLFKLYIQWQEAT